MENASKALIMAGGMLIGILVLTLAVYLFVSFGSQASKVHKQVHDTQIDQFNSQFNVYLDNDKITIYDIVSVAKSAYEYNQTTTNTTITVELKGYPVPNPSPFPASLSFSKLEADNWKNNYEELFKLDRDGMQDIKNTRTDSETISKIGYLPRYKCKDTSSEKAIEYDGDTGRIKIIRFNYVGS